MAVKNEGPWSMENRRLKSWLMRLLLVVAVLAVADPRSAIAQQSGGGPVLPPFDWQNLQISATPYLWLAGPSVTTRTPLPNAPSVKSDRSALDTLGHLNGVPFLGAFEIRDDAFGFVGDFIHLPVATNITTRNVFFTGGTAALTANTGSALFLYRPYADALQYLDVGGGFRGWDFSAGLSLNGGLLPSVSVSRSASWFDGLFAVRYHRELGDGFGLTAYGDVGAGGANIDWQLLGTVDYTANSWLTLRAGYRSLNFDYELGSSNLGFNVHLNGPIVAGTIQF